MVGAGDVDEELEGEVKDECNTKYGDVMVVSICEIKNAAPDEAVRIFVEFKRIESAIKAVVDLNGRFFGGRQVKAGFYAYERFKRNMLLDWIVCDADRILTMPFIFHIKLILVYVRFIGKKNFFE